MTAQTKNSRKPSHTVYHVRGEGEKAFWTKIGAAWTHEDQDGLNVALDYMPIGEGRLVIRTSKDDAKAPEAKAA